MGENELAIINALLLGQKQDISSALYKNYTNSGAIHILAVSGLHVGVLLLLLQHILTPLFHFKNGSLYKIFLIVIILWAFALLTGGSASVIRATTMFTIVTIAINIKRKTNIYNTLIASAFVILIFKPQFIFDVGFQLSYSAVFSIVAFQPLIVKLWQAPNKIIGFFWNTFSVTLAAQFAVLPISLFYFHQFPGLFWLSNLIIIPALPLILGLGLLCILGILLQLPEKITGVMVYGLEQLIAYMNQYLQWISSFENFIIKDIHFNPLLTVSSLLLVVAVYCIWSQFNAKRFISLGVSIIGLQLSFLYSNYTSNRNEFVIFHRSKSTQIALKKNASLNFYSHEAKENQLTRSYKIGSNVKTVLYDSLIPYFTINNTRIMIIDSTAIYDLKSFKPDIILLTQSPKLNLERLIETIQPKKIIADGSNYKSYVKRWKETCKHKKGLFHTTEKGAYIYSF
jgi:competence protein ComEC